MRKQGGKSGRGTRVQFLSGESVGDCASRTVAAATPEYFVRQPPPRTPHELATHDCINLRLETYGGMYAWEFEKDGQALNVCVEGQLVFNSSLPMLRAALAGFGLACVPEDIAQEHIAEGRLIRVLEAWCPAFPGYHLLSLLPEPAPVVAGLCVAGRCSTP